MRYVVTGEQMQKADKYTIETIGIPSLVLMERAALKVVEAIENAMLDLSKILVVCGSGNNGGDGYAIARLLYLKGYHTEIYFVGNDSNRSVENQKQQEIAMYYHIPIIDTLENDNYTVIIDAIFGTGLKRMIEGKYYSSIERLNQMQGNKVAVDIPSGINDTTGNVMGIAFKADLTVSLAFEKRGIAFYPGRDFAGEIIVSDIGITENALPQDGIYTCSYEYDDLKKRFPKRKNASHKGTYGKVLMIVGSKGMAGAAYLSAKAAYAVGAGLVQIYTTEDNRSVLQQLLPEAIITTYQEFHLEQLKKLLDWADVTAIGCGLGTDVIARQLLQNTLALVKDTCIVDADGLNILSEHMEWIQNCQAKLIFTPHMREMTRLLQCDMQTLVEKRMEFLIKFVEKYSVTCVLKDARTLVACPQNWVYLNQSGNAAMAKGGSGDVLTGIIAGIAAQSKKAFDAATSGVYLHGLSGDAAKNQKGLHSVLASDIIDSISEILKEI